MVTINKDLVAASSTPLVLAILAEGDSYGYAILRRVRDLSGGELEWTDGMLYPVLHRLERSGAIESRWEEAESGRRRKYYRLTPSGRRQLADERRQWQTVDQALAKSFGLDQPAGVIVNGVEPGGPAERAGMLPGDIILTFDGREVGRPSDLPTMVAETRPGTKTQVEVWRKGDRRKLTVTVGELPDDTVALAAARRATASGGAYKSEAAGLAVRVLTPEERQATRSDGGVIVENVQGPAARAGIQPGDVIIRVNDKPIAKPEELREAIATAGEAIALLVQRDNKRVYVAVTPG